MLRTWLYTLQNQSGDSYTVDAGTVTTEADPTPLDNTPDGWADILIGYERNMQKVGTVRSFTFPLGFVRYGARILRHLLYSNSFEEKITLLIQKLTLDTTASTYQWVYEPFYSGEIDLATLKDEEHKVSVSVAESGIPKALKANESTTQQIDVDGHPEAVFVKMDGVYLKEKHNWLVTEAECVASHLIGTGFMTKEGQAAGFASFSTYNNTTPSNYQTSQEYFAATRQDITGIELSWKPKFQVLNNAAGPSFIALKTNTGRTLKLYEWPTTLNETTYELDINYTFDAEAGENFFLIFEIANGAFTTIKYSESPLSISYQSRYRTTTVKGLLETTLLKELTEKVTGDDTACKSDLLTTGEKLVLTSIDAIRSIPGAKIKTSLSTFMSYCYAMHGAGWGVESNKIRVEAFAHFLKTTSPNSLGNAKDLKTSVATDLLANTIKVGYNTPAIDDVNGKYSFNNTLLFSTPVTKVTKEHQILSPYYADPYFIEIKRINFEGKTTTDDSADNDIVVLNVEPIAFAASGGADNFWIFGNIFTFPDQALINEFPEGSKFTVTGTGSNNKAFTVRAAPVAWGTGMIVGVEEAVVTETFTAATFTTNVYKLRRKAYSEVEGLPTGVESSLFNIEYLTPKRMLTRHLTWLNSMLWGLQGQYLKFQTTEKNAGLKTTYGADVVDEDADVAIGEDRLFLPFYHEFETRVPVNLPALMEADPNASFSTDWNGVTLNGILIKAGIAPDTNKEQAWKLLSAPDNDLTQLISG